MLPADQRVILISGANRGIGRAIAERLYRDGYRLSLGVRRPKSLEPVTGNWPAERFLAQPYDAQDREAARAWVTATVERFGRIDGLVNNAGIFRRVTVEDDDEDALDAMWEVNAKGPFRLIQAAFPHLKAAGSGRVVTLVSLSGKRVKSASIGGYAMSKFAALALSQAARYSGWEHGVRSTAICPGFVRTEMTAGTKNPPPERMIPPETVAGLVSTVLSLPNEASVSEIPVNCVLEHSY